MSLSRIAKWVAAWAAGVATSGVIALLIIYSGAFDATATKPHEPIVAWATHTAFVRSVRLRAGTVKAPAHFTRDQVVAGLIDYDQHCSACHGAPGVGRAAFAAGMIPTPPYLLDASHQWTPAELYWIVHEGVKMTAMPAWSESQSDRRVWNVVAFLEALPAISAEDYAGLREVQALPPSAARAAVRPAGAGYGPRSDRERAGIFRDKAEFETGGGLAAVRVRPGARPAEVSGPRR